MLAEAAGKEQEKEEKKDQQGRTTGLGQKSGEKGPQQTMTKGRGEIRGKKGLAQEEITAKRKGQQNMVMERW